MIAVDTNLLVYAHRPDSEHHLLARRALTELAASGAPWAIPWPCVHEFLGVVSRAYRPPTSMADAIGVIETLLGLPACHALGETRDHLSVLTDILTASGATGPQVHDARIAAICRSHGVGELWTADRDFGRFPWLRTRNPLVTGSST